MPLHLGQRLRRILNVEDARAFQLFNSFKEGDQLLGRIPDQAGIRKTEVAAIQRRQWITEGALAEFQLFEETGKMVEVLDQPAEGDACGGWDTQFTKNLVGAAYFSAHVRESTVALMDRRVMCVNREDHAGEA